MARQRVLVLYGGRSSEHEISCLSARSVLEALDEERYEVVPVGITRQGRWRLTDGMIEPADGEQLPTVADEGGETVGLVRGREEAVLTRLDESGHEIGHGGDLGPVDVCFPVLHGPYGEDGTVQGLLATVGVAYVGADVTASAMGIDKRAMKAAFAARGLAQGPYLAVRRERHETTPDEVADDIEAALSYPVFTKPARQGSSIGITKCRDAGELADGLTTAFGYGRVVIVEQGFEDPRELEVGVLGNEQVEVTAPGEIVPSHEFYDYEAKYLDASELIVPAELPERLSASVAQHARRAYRALGCRGMARVDFFLDDVGQVWVNEINTIPGFTPSSMFPLLWEAEGLDYPALVDRLLQLAFEVADGDANYAP